MWCMRAINICMEKMLAVRNASANKHFHWGIIWHHKEKETESFRWFFWIKVAVRQRREWARWRLCYKDKTNLLVSLKCPMILSQWIQASNVAWKVLSVMQFWYRANDLPAFWLLFTSQPSIPPSLSQILTTLSRFLAFCSRNIKIHICSPYG